MQAAYWSIFGILFLYAYAAGVTLAAEFRINPVMIGGGARALPMTMDEERRGSYTWAWQAAAWWPLELVFRLVRAVVLGLVCLGLLGLNWMVLLAGGVESRVIDLLDAVEERLGAAAPVKPSNMEGGPE